MSDEVVEKMAMAVWLARRVDWGRYPHLAAVFKNRPPENIYWRELVGFVEECVELYR